MVVDGHTQTVFGIDLVTVWLQGGPFKYQLSMLLIRFQSSIFLCFTSVVFLRDCLLVLHSILIMVQASTLNVAFNSHNKSLLTIMMSNNVSGHAHACYPWYACCQQWLCAHKQKSVIWFGKQLFTCTNKYVAHVHTNILMQLFVCKWIVKNTQNSGDVMFLMQLQHVCFHFSLLDNERFSLYFSVVLFPSYTVCGDQRKCFQEVWEEQPIPNVQQW